MSFIRTSQRQAAKKEYKLFIKNNPQFRTLTLNSFVKMSAGAPKLPARPRSAVAEKPHVHGPDCQHDSVQPEVLQPEISVDDDLSDILV